MFETRINIETVKNQTIFNTMETPTKLLIPSQTTIRFSDDERNFINDNLNKLINSFDKPESEISRNELMVKAFTEAIAKKTPEVLTQDSEETTNKLKLLEEANKDLNNSNQELTLQVEELNAKLSAANNNQLPAGAIVLNLDRKAHMQFWGILELCKKAGYAKTYEELLNNMFIIFQARNEFVITAEDAQYLNTLEYDGPGENTEATAGE